jgi:hypothetical protein
VGSPHPAPASTAPIYLSRIGRHECCDRIVFDLNGPAPVGYHVGYVPVVTEDGSGGAGSGPQPDVVFAPSGVYLHGPGGLADWGALRGVRSAGSFEGQSIFAVGVRDRLPFLGTTWVDGNRIAQVIVDIAHRAV